MRPIKRCKLGSTPINVNPYWRVQYRDANCTFYGTWDGTIRQVRGAECMRYMTEDRAHELEEPIKID